MSLINVADLVTKENDCPPEAWHFSHEAVSEGTLAASGDENIDCLPWKK